MAANGRPTVYTKKLAEEICEQLKNGRSLRSICLDEGMPHRTSVFTWLDRYPDFLDQYKRAREQQADTLFDECLDIAEDGSNDWMERQSKSGEVFEVPNHEHISRSKLRIDTRMAMIKRLAPKKYIEKSALELSGAEGGAIRTDNRVKIEFVTAGAGDADTAS